MTLRILSRFEPKLIKSTCKKRSYHISLHFLLKYGILYRVNPKGSAVMPSNSSVILTAAMMQACDRFTIEELGIPSQTLMESAAGFAGKCLLERRDLFPAGKILVLCGCGNNGGDGFAMARFLTDGSLGTCCDVKILYVGKASADGVPDATRMSTECARQYRLAIEAGVTVLTLSAADDALHGVSAVVDAIFGIGLDRPVTEEISSLLDRVKQSGLPVLAIDIPSGVHADSGRVLGAALPARLTVTMQALKAGLLLYPGADLCGEIIVCNLGISLSPVSCPYGMLSDASLLRRVLLPRERRTHKGTYGKLNLLCGSEGMNGAAILATRGALRSGLGLAHVLTPVCNRTVLQVTVPEAIVSVYETPEEASHLAQGDGLVIGCGLGTSEKSRNTLRAILNASR
jgi:NAD(P)H-hydrate epimerase